MREAETKAELRLFILSSAVLFGYVVLNKVFDYCAVTRIQDDMKYKVTCRWRLYFLICFFIYMHFYYEAFLSMSEARI